MKLYNLYVIEIPAGWPRALPRALH